MYKSLFSLFFCFFTWFSINAQQIEAFSGVNYSKFYKGSNNEPGNTLIYDKLEPGITFGLAIDSIKMDWMYFRFDLVFNQYSGGFYYNTSGHGGESYVNGKFEKSTLALVVYPLQFNILKRIRFNLGLSFSYLLDENFSGKHHSLTYSLTPPPPPPPAPVDYNLEDKYSSYSNRFGFGVQPSISYPIHISDNWIIRPLYSLYIGVSKEFRYSPSVTSNCRHFIGIGVLRNLRK